MPSRAIQAAAVALMMVFTSPALADVWEDFADAIRDGGALIDDAKTPQDERTRAEGYRQLSRMLRLAFWSFVEFGADPAHPTIFLATDPADQTGGTTSHAMYHQMFLNGTDTYRITGRRGTFPLFEFNLTEGRVGHTATAKTVDFVTERSLRGARRRKFEIWISPDCGSLIVDNCLRSTPDALWLIIRQYSAKPWKEKSATFHVENMTTGFGRNPSTDGRFTEEQIGQRLLTAAAFAKGIQAHFKRNMDLIRSSLPPNSMVFVSPAQTGGNALPNGHNFSVGHFLIQPDEALVVDFEPPRDPVPPFWNFQLVDYWFRPLDYWSRHESSVADRTVTRQSDRSIRLVLAHDDPGICNWLDLKGYIHGNMQFRLSRDLDQPHPNFQMTLMKLADVQAAAPERRRRCKVRGPENYQSPLLRFWD